jgi:hypothetical protein
VLERVDGEDKVERRVVAVDELRAVAPLRDAPLEVVAEAAQACSNIGARLSRFARLSGRWAICWKILRTTCCWASSAEKPSWWTLWKNLQMRAWPLLFTMMMPCARRIRKEAGEKPKGAP